MKKTAKMQSIWFFASVIKILLDNFQNNFRNSIIIGYYWRVVYKKSMIFEVFWEYLSGFLIFLHEIFFGRKILSKSSITIRILKTSLKVPIYSFKNILTRFWTYTWFCKYGLVCPIFIILYMKLPMSVVFKIEDLEDWRINWVILKFSVDTSTTTLC